MIEDPEDEKEAQEEDSKTTNYIASTTQSVGDKSFVDRKQKFRENCPPPKYFSNEILLAPLSTSKEDILNGFITPPVGGLICIDEEALEA